MTTDADDYALMTEREFIEFMKDPWEADAYLEAIVEEMDYAQTIIALSVLRKAGHFKH